MKTFQIPKLIAGGIITNYHCTSRCRHCLYQCSPRREKGYLKRSKCESIMDVIKKKGCTNIHIGGGEPMLKPNALAGILEVTKQNGVSVEYVETNSSWYVDAQSAEHLLKDLKHSGLKTLLISISPFHNEYIPFYKTVGVLEACRKAGVQTFPWISNFIQDLSMFDPMTTHELKEYKDKYGREYLNNLSQRYWIHPGGRALTFLRKTIPKKSLDQILTENSGSCQHELSSTDHFHVDLHGNYIPGLCSGLTIHIEDLNQSLLPDQYPVISTLWDFGIRGLFQMAQKQYNYRPQKSTYTHKCEVCTEIRTYLIKNNKNLERELGPLEFYS